LVREILEETDGAVEEVYPIWTGTEHAVCFVPDLASTDVEWEGRRIRRDPTFAPAGVNVDFVEIGHMDEAHQTAVVSARTFEKGVEAETLACGTGAVAAAVVAASRYYRKAAAVQVRMPGGTLTVGITRTGDEISEMYLDGPAAVVYRGSFEISA
jgi:diaminopimelate epimerase